MQSVFDSFVDGGGANVIAVVGPQGAGKSFHVQQYLAARAKKRRSEQRSPSIDHKVIYAPLKLLQLEAGSGKQTMLGVLGAFVKAALLGQAVTTGRGSQIDSGVLSLVRAIQHYFEHVAVGCAGHELHLILDDADIIRDQSASTEVISSFVEQLLVNSMWMATVAPPSLHVWVISRIPIPLANCVRFCFISKPTADEVMKWLEVTSHDAVPSEATSRREGTTTASLSETAVRHFMTRKPMSACVITSDPRLLLRSVATLIPTLAAMQAHHPQTPLNDLDLSKAWASLNDETAAQSAAGALRTTHQGMWLQGMRKLGISPMILAVAAFYCGCVTPGRDRVVFGKQLDRTRRGSATAHTSMILSSSTHAFRESRLLSVYRFLLPMLTHVADPSLSHEVPVAAPLASHFLRSLMEWGLVSAVVGHRQLLHCHISVGIATAIAQDLGIQLMDLIPNR